MPDAGPGRWVEAPRQGAAAAEGTLDSLAGPPATVAGPPPEPRTAPGAAAPGAATGTGKTSRFDQPRWVMLRSLVVPGWGQVHNHAWLKAAAVVGGEAWLGLKMLSDRRRLDDLLVEISNARAAGDDARELNLVDDYNMRLDTFVSRQWILGGVVALALLDAYIDAHFRGFQLEFQGDPALPGGKVPAAQLRIRVRGSF